jgi:hypothetical protein
MLCFDYDLSIPSLTRLITLSNRSQWNAEDIDWKRPLSLRGGEYEAVLEWHGILRYDYVMSLPPRKTEELARQFVAVEFSQILHGEQAALMLAGQLTSSVTDLDARIFAANQAKDEARHVTAVRDLVQRIGPIYPCGEVLHANLTELLECNIWPKQVLGLQLFLEARALLSFRQHLLFVKDPVFRDVTMRIERDEAHHVAFGIQYLENGIAELGEEEQRELFEYARFLDQNLWYMTQQDEYRAAFEECDLDFDECFRRAPTSFLAPRLGADKTKSVEDMHHQFAGWFKNAMSRVGLAEAIEGEASNAETLPWIPPTQQEPPEG